MKFYNYYEQKNLAEIDRLITETPYCLLLTQDMAKPRTVTGLFNHVYDGKNFYLHLNKTDEQVAALDSGRAQLVFHDMLALIPSYWVEEKYAGAATAYYRYAEFDCDVALERTPAGMIQALQLLMNHHQPEGHYDPLSADSSIYETSLAMLVIAKLTPTARRTKWKLGQNRPVETRMKVVENLRARAKGNDLRAAEEVLRALKS